MIISPGRRYIFVHIPKTGGTSLALALEDRAMKDDILIGDTPKAQRRKRRLQEINAPGRVWKHATLADIEGVVPLDDKLVFTLVRNPWDRVVSYYHWLKDQNFSHPAVALAKQQSFTDFVCAPATQSALRANPYGHYVTGAAAPVFVRIEHFAADIAPVVAHLGFDLELPRVNASDRARDWTRYYCERSKAIIAEVCAEDIERFGYTFEHASAIVSD